MNRQDIITSIASLEAQISELHGKESLVEQKYNDLVKRFWFPHLCDYRVIEKGFFLDCNRSYFTIKRFREGKAFSDTMLTVYANESYLRAAEEAVVRDLETSFYTTSENSTFELERMVMIGKIGQLLLDKSEELIAGLSELLKVRNVELAAHYKQRWEYERQVKEFKNLLDVLDVQEAMGKLREGVNFENKKGPYPRLRFRGNDDSAIRSLKITNIKGKSANIEYTSNCTDRVLGDTIRLNNIETFIQYYKNEILNAESEVVVG